MWHTVAVRMSLVTYFSSSLARLVEEIIDRSQVAE